LEPNDKNESPLDEQGASPEEVKEAISDLSDPDHRRLRKAAGAIFSFRPVLWELYEPKDLVSKATLAALAGERKWPKGKVDIAKFLIEAMRSIAWNDVRKLKDGTQPRFVSEHDLKPTEQEDDATPSIEVAAGSVPSVEDGLLESEEHAKGQANLALVRAQLADDKDLAQIFDHYLKGLTKREIRRKLGMTDGQFWSADRRLNRRLEQILKHLNDDDN
jgi:DNA-directed RNA polymerase specialized sigma24 family protein